jgi:hypothetical protein
LIESEIQAGLGRGGLGGCLGLTKVKRKRRQAKRQEGNVVISP